ncbi:hypothetical protein [Nostocoides sp. HKS02]|uniref:hypothetical protein n=1 Tax=Nostocoides sp. HKS02 TaxID=1813880 RepID=UPI0012B4F0FA|nr:hypothetical protein [Tetrasphaera sp. HKS02]QGN58005.1 hypothetical protein GKE56_09035 [Tetrasphaera sp. HKS02]
MSTTAAPAPTQVSVDGGETPRSGFRPAVVLAVLLTVPAVYLVGKGELSAHDALVRFGCAWAFATAGIALVLSTVGGSSAPRTAASFPTSEDRSGEGAGDEAAV